LNAELPNFEAIGSRGYYRPRGIVTLDQGLAMLIAAVEHARTLGLQELVLNATGLTGYSLPTVNDRYEFSSKIAAIGAGALRIAQVIPAEIIDPQHFGVLVAANRDLETNVFPTEAEAIAWLDEGNER
jgi:hypothetical protein